MLLLHTVLLVEGNLNYMNKWIFGHKAINKLYALGYVPGNQYSQKESTAEDAQMDNRLTMDILHQLCHPLATMSADADKCYDCINHIIMLLLLLAIVSCIGNIVTMLHPIQTMKFFQQTAQGDSTTFMGGRGKDNPLQGLCQGNGAALACWLMLSSVLMHCYQCQGFGWRIISPMSGAIINFLGEIYVNDTDLIITRPEFDTALRLQEGLQAAAWAWASGLNATGGAINPEKSRWIYAGYTWTDGTWEYAPQPNLPMEIPLPDSTSAMISQGEVLAAEKALGVWSTVDSNDNEHLAQNITGCIKKWISKIKNGHLPACLGWVAYKFKLWLGVGYGLATLAMPLEAAQKALQCKNFHILPFLGVNQNVKWEWRSLHCVFGGIGLYSLPVEHTIAMINMLIQHYGAETTLAKKFSASIKALQLEIGCIGNPLNKNHDKFHLLATHSWIKSLWERLHFYKFTLHLEYRQLDMPQRDNALLVTMFWMAG